ncbi:MAG: DUF167 domain-containing protein [Rhodospirillales bacterium]|nr:DUF167 domain-containing protein [Alphaproteobacteria bacterium]MBL6948471.1 DUF167 domain-containing protein [Rhodospirillales bacterium]
MAENKPVAVPWAAADGGVLLSIRLTPNASASRIGPVVTDDAGNTVLKAAVTEIPEDGKANRALIKLLAKSWGLPKTAISLKRGHKDRLKTLLIENRAFRGDLEKHIQGQIEKMSEDL